MQTNLYADQQRLAKNDTSGWNPITLNKLKAFIGITFAMGIISLPAINDYWSTDPIMSHSWFRALMSRNRYRQILRHIHVVDNTSAPTRTDPNTDRLWKVRPLIDLLQHTCGEMRNPGQQLSIDESMIGTKCSLFFIQYLPAKPTKWGIKVWVCSDAATGYVLSFSIYTGKDLNVSILPNGLVYDVVMRLLENKFNKGYSVFVDNFYTSPNLFLDLFNKGVPGTGTVRTNRKNFPSELREAWDKKPPRVTSIFHHYGPITAVRWFDNIDVYALSTYEGDVLTSVRRRHEGETTQICCPNIISSYNSSMGCVDLTDQYMSYYSVGRKTMKGWHHVFWRMHDHAAINGLVVHRSNCRPSEKPETNKQFRIQLAYALVADFVVERCVSACLSDPPR